jgi:deoxyribodipyrimidine photo-lyase
MDVKFTKTTVSIRVERIVNTRLCLSARDSLLSRQFERAMRRTHPWRCAPRAVVVLYGSNDLRLHDHYAMALAARRAAELDAPLVACYCFDPRTLAQPSLVGGFFRTGPRRAAFLLECVADLRGSLRGFGSELLLRVGEPEAVVPALCAQLGAVEVFATTQCAPHEAFVQRRLGARLEEGGGGSRLRTVWGTTFIHVDDLITPPAQMREQLRVFWDEARLCNIRPTKPFNCDDGRLRRAVLPPAVADGTVAAAPLPTLRELGYGEAAWPPSANATELVCFNGGESQALARYDTWVNRQGLNDYVAMGRMWKTRVPGNGYQASKLSPWIAHGCLSPRRFYEDLREHSYDRMGRGTTEAACVEAFHRLYRRDYWHFLGLKWGRTLFFPYGPNPEETDDIAEYRHDNKIITKWCNGLTGVPFADAAMTQLRESGWVGVAQKGALMWLLSKGYGQDWRVGAEWLERCSLDYDPFLMWGNCAYQAGLIKDRFGDRVHGINYVAYTSDTSATYTKKWLPQLTKVPDLYIHRLHVMTDRMQGMHGVRLGRSYPYPMKLWPGAQHQIGALPTYVDAGSERAVLGSGVGEAERLRNVAIPVQDVFPYVTPAVAAADSRRRVPPTATAMPIPALET